jgi:cyanophycin synthetase
VWLFSLDHDHPAIRAVLAEGGRAVTVLDGRMTVLERSTARSLVRLEDVPVTIAGISSPNIQNAMAAAAAALGIGLPERAVVRGLRSFVLDQEANPGRANLFKLDERVVVVDYAHNEAGMMGLTEICGGLRRRGREVWMAICTAGDRRADIIHAFAYRAASPGDVVAVTALGQRPEMFAWLEERGAQRLGPEEVRRLARSVRASRAKSRSG